MAPIGPERVLVIGDDMRIFLSVVRSLGRAGKEVHAVPFDDQSPALRSKYVHRVHAVPAYHDGPMAWRDALLALLQACQFKLVVPTCDRAILSFDAFRQSFEQFPIALPNAAAMETLFDKHCTRELATSLGIPVAAGRELQPGDTADILIRDFGLPLALKPRRSYWLSRESYDSRGQVAIIRTASDLAARLAAVQDRSRYIVERHFHGVGVGVSVLASTGRITHAFQHRRLREGRSGSSSRISEHVDRDLLHACEAICRHTGLSGVGMFEFRCNPATRDWVLLEVNARFWGSLPLALSLGVDFPRFLYDLLVLKTERPLVAYPAGIKARNFALDGRNLLADIPRLDVQDLGRWLSDVADFLAQPIRWMTGTERSDTFVRDDLKPALLECARLLRSGARRLLPRSAARRATTFGLRRSIHGQR
jgi:predicted ATP-grasp superfamily ATP-dependent carboligase